MANTQTTVPLFVANQVLTAAQQNTSAGTGVPVFATTVTRDAAFGGSNKALAEGQLCYLESTNVVQYYDGAAWATVGPGASGGMTLLSTTTLSGASTTISSIDQTYNQIYGTISGVTNATGNGIFRCYVNNDSTGHNYLGSRWDGSTNAAVSGTNIYWSMSANNSIVRTTATNFFSFVMNNYSATASYKNINWSGQWNGGEMFVGSYQHMSNTAITSLVFNNSGGNLSTGTVLLYGVK